MRPLRDYYEILGVPSTATTAEIKRRYRELARKFHPDVAKDKAVGHRAFSQIAEAYKTLSDPDQRRAYDASRSSSGPSQSRTYQSRPTGTRPTAPPGERSVIGDRLVNEAMHAFNTRRLQQAMNICRQAIRLNRNNARAHAILADIYRIQGKKEQAILEYGYAVQFNPADRESQEKLEKLLQPKGGRARVSAEAARRRRQEPDEYSAEIRSAANVANIVGWGLCFFLLFLINLYPGSPIPGMRIYFPSVSTWSWNLVGILALNAALMGFLMAVNKLVDHPDEELMFQYVPGTMIPVGIPLLIFSMVFFYVTAAVTLGLNFLLGSFSKSLAWMFAAVTVLTLGAALMYQPGHVQVALYGGNIAFPAAVIGWYIGSMFGPMEK
ncbi:MAG: J domain-containing protein [Armatimonadota bacterium]|nr:J domain-containing protein [Armatimonadota bacterium]